MEQSDHPVWGVYDRLRSARLSVKYYGKRLDYYENLNKTLEIVTAITAPTSVVAGFWFWQTANGKIIWTILSLITAIISIIKPFLELSKKIKDFEGILIGYKTIDHDLMTIKESIQQNLRYDKGMQADLIRVNQRERDLKLKIVEATENKKIKRICEAEVNAELPAASFFIPKE